MNCSAIFFPSLTIQGSEKKIYTKRLLPFSILLVLLFAFFLMSCEEDVENTTVEIKKTVFSGFSPAEGGEGDLVILSGENFSQRLQPIKVKFGEFYATVESVTKDNLLVRLPSYITNCGDVSITVVSDTSTLYSKQDFKIACPTIESFTPTKGDIKDIITIHGADFTSDVSRIKVTIGTTDAEVIAASPSVINVKLLNGYSGYHPITVQISQKIGVSSDLFRINGPIITSFATSTEGGCDKIVITGSDFSSVASENKVFFAAKQGIVESATLNQLIVAPPYDLKEIAGVPVNIFITVNGKRGYSSDKITLVETAWQKKASLHNIGRWKGVGFAIGQKGYTGTGGTIENGLATLQKDFWEYNEIQDTWIRKADLPGDARIDAVGFEINGKGYVGLGVDFSNVFSNDFWEYDPNTNSWLQLPDFPGAGRASAIAFSVGGKGYVGLGSGLESTDDIWEFDPQNKMWTKVTDYPGAGKSGMVCFAIENKAYIGTGLLTNDFWEYTPSTKQWRQLNNFPESFIQYGVSFAFNGFGIAGTGGTSNGNRLDRIWKYDPATDQWSRLQNFGGNVRAYAVGFPLTDGFMIGTGSTTFNIDETNDFYKYVCE